MDSIQQSCNFETGNSSSHRTGGELGITREPKFLDDNRQGFERMRELSGVVIMFSTLIRLLITWVYSYIKSH